MSDIVHRAIDEFRLGSAGFNEIKVVELVPGRRVRWACVDGFASGERPERGALRAARLEEQVEFVRYCGTKWGTGKGTPYPDDVGRNPERAGMSAVLASENAAGGAPALQTGE